MQCTLLSASNSKHLRLFPNANQQKCSTQQLHAVAHEYSNYRREMHFMEPQISFKFVYNEISRSTAAASLVCSIIKRFEIHLIILSQCKIEARSTTPLNALKPDTPAAQTFSAAHTALRYYSFYIFIFSPRAADKLFRDSGRSQPCNFPNESRSSRCVL